MPTHIVTLPANFESTEDDAGELNFRAVFARVDPDDLEGSRARCAFCDYTVLLYPSAFTNGAAAPFQVGHWSDLDVIPMGAGRIETSESEAALVGTFAATDAVRETVARMAHQLTYGLGEVSASLDYQSIREGDELTEAERMAGVDVALDRAEVVHVAAVQRGGAPNTRIELYSSMGGTCQDASCAPPVSSSSAHSNQSTACSVAEAQAEAALMRGAIRRPRYAATNA